MWRTQAYQAFLPATPVSIFTNSSIAQSHYCACFALSRLSFTLRPPDDLAAFNRCILTRAYLPEKPPNTRCTTGHHQYKRPKKQFRTSTAGTLCARALPDTLQPLVQSYSASIIRNPKSQPPHTILILIQFTPHPTTHQRIPLRNKSLPKLPPCHEHQDSIG